MRERRRAPRRFSVRPGTSKSRQFPLFSATGYHAAPSANRQSALELPLRGVAFRPRDPSAMRWRKPETAMPMKPPIIVFDLDGTLVDTAPDLLASMNHALVACGLDPVEDTVSASMSAAAPASCSNAPTGAP
jgi:hypothetical protein